MVKPKLEKIVDLVINAFDKNYELITIKDSDGIESSFYDPETKKCKNNLNKNVANLMNIPIYEYPLYVVRHPHKTLKVWAGIYGMKKRVIDKREIS